MVLTVDNISPSEYAGAMLFRHADVTIDYDTGGVTFVPATLNMNRFQNVILTINDGSTNEVRYDESTDSLMVYDQSGAEVAAGTTVSVSVTGIGR